MKTILTQPERGKYIVHKNQQKNKTYLENNFFLKNFAQPSPQNYSKTKSMRNAQLDFKKKLLAHVM